MKLTIFIMKFLFIGALFIVSNQNLHLKNPDELSQFADLFIAWLSTILSHASKITGYVANSEWLPQNIILALPR